MELNTINSLLTGMKNLFIGKSSIVQNTEISDTTKIPSSVVTKNLQEQITQLNNNLAKKANTSHNHNYLIILDNNYYKHFTASPSDYLKEGNGLTVSAVSFYGADETYDPPTGKGYYKWYNVLTFGTGNRCTQIATQTFLNSESINGQSWIRIQHDNRVSSWHCFITPF